jgi:REP element-mobilizing transposase RayT
MPRPPRLEFSSALYHVTARGNERRAIFRDDRDREKYLARIAFYRERFHFQLLAYCLMTNHVHLAIRTGPSPLSRIMAGLHSSYAEWFNRRHDRSGHLFQGRYKAFVVQEERYLHSLVRYIHRNPVRARIAERACDYPWSSDRFLRRGRGPDWLDVDGLLSLLDDSRRVAVGRYVELVDGPEAAPPYEDLPAAGRAAGAFRRPQSA